MQLDDYVQKSSRPQPTEESVRSPETCLAGSEHQDKVRSNFSSPPLLLSLSHTAASLIIEASRFSLPSKN